MSHSRAVGELRRRIALDVAPLRGHPAGVGIYVARLAAALAATLGEQLVLIGRRADAELPDAALESIRATPFRHRHYHAWMQLDAPRAARRMGAELVHFTNAAAPLVGGRPYVLTVHDLSVLVMPGSHPRARLMTVPITLAAIRGARRLIVPSQATADELERVLRIDRRRVTVVPHAPPPFEALPEAADAGHGLDELGLRSGGYLVLLGTIEPRKNHERLITAFEGLIDRGHDLRLVITGSLGWGSSAVLQRIERSSQRERIRLTGYLPEARLRALIRASAAACYVSLYEGFGLPVIEAMAAGAPVVTSNVSSMPEVAGGAAVLVDPLDVEAIRAGIEQALAERDSLIAGGLAWAAQRSWADVARETVSVYREAIEG